jgi:hypothetical protein
VLKEKRPGLPSEAIENLADFDRRPLCPDSEESGQLDRIFQAARGIPLLKPGAAAPTSPLQKRGIVAKFSDWQRQCPRPMVRMKPVTQPADGGKGAAPYCWSWPLDFLFLAPPRAHYIMRCGR